MTQPTGDGLSKPWRVLLLDPGRMRGNNICMNQTASYSIICEALEAEGLRARGGFVAEPTDSLPADVGSIILVGNIGGSMWPSFEADRRDVDNPLDDWSKRTLGSLVDRLPGAIKAVFPSDGPPYMPFQQWALRAEPVHPSPLGPLIHPEYGLWHAYRGAILFSGVVGDLPIVEPTTSPCSICVDKPCLTTCPVGAIDEDEGGLDVSACATHLKTHAGDACLAAACKARRACPVGVDFRYGEPQARFHMGAFLRSRG